MSVESMINDVQNNLNNKESRSGSVVVDNLNFHNILNGYWYSYGPRASYGVDSIPWNSESGVYTGTYSGASSLVAHFKGNGSTAAAQIRFNYKNGGMWYKSARDSNGFEEGWTQVYTSKDLNFQISGVGNSIVKRDGSGDITSRLFRSTYGDESRMQGAVAFRVNTSDNYIRFCNNPAAFRTWLGLDNTGGKCDLLWSGNFHMDGGKIMTLSGKDFSRYQMIILHCSVEPTDGIWQGMSTCNLTLTTYKYGVPSGDQVDLMGDDWCGAYLVDNNRIRVDAWAGVWVRYVYGIR